MPVTTEERAEPKAWEPPLWAVLPAFTLTTFLMIFRNPARLRSHVVSDLGDPILNLWIMRWVSGHTFNSWSVLWNAGIFYPAKNTLAYSESMFPVAMVFAVFRPFLGSVLAYNLLYLAQWTAALYCAYRLCMYFTKQWIPSLVGALVFTFGTVRTMQYGHTQLAASWLIPLILLAIVRLLDKPSWQKGLIIGVCLGILTISASYYGELMAVAVAVMCVLGIVIIRSPISKLLQGLVVAGVVAVAIVAPFAHQYLELEKDPYFVRASDQQFAARIGDYFAVSQDNYVWGHAPVMKERSAPNVRNVERRLFPGAMGLVLGIAGFGLVFLAPSRWAKERIRLSSRQKRLLLLVAAAGLVGFLLAFGQYLEVGHRHISMPSAWLRGIVPGFKGIRAPARFAVLAQCALGVFAAIGAAFLMQLFTKWRQLALGGLLVALVLAETAFHVVLVPVPTIKKYGAVNQALEKRPAGPVVELPIRSSGDPDWPWTETSRQLLALEDGHPRVNGYSGWQPEGFTETAQVLNTFPSAQAFTELHDIGVRYVVLRTKAVGAFPPGLAFVYTDGMGEISPQRAAQMVKNLPADQVQRVNSYNGAILIQLRPAHNSQ